MRPFIIAPYVRQIERNVTDKRADLRQHRTDQTYRKTGPGTVRQITPHHTCVRFRNGPTVNSIQTPQPETQRITSQGQL